MPLADFIDANIDLLLADWVDQARRLGAAPTISTAHLRDSAQRLFMCIAQDMRTSQSDTEQSAKSYGERPANAPAMIREARAHAEQRFEQGFSLNELIAEYRALRASVVRHWLATGTCGGVEALAELVRFDEAVDQALAESASRYSSEVERTRDLFVGILAHDLRTPLGAIAMSAQYLLQAEEIPVQVLRVSATVQRSGARMQRIIEDLVDFTRTRLGGMLPVHLQPANVGNICRQAITEIEALHPNETVRWLSDGDLSGNWDGIRLGQLLTNLLQNAIDHGRAGSPITVTTHGLDDAVQLSVFNEGEPISAAALKSIFDPLTRTPLDAEPRRAGAGLGLGLFIARQITLAHGGTLEVRSENDGTTFTATLPRDSSRTV
ncbi:sensor histidine kinase [Paraburkholderia sp. JHI869]|uniref:sensor histidine kinase n=1 Tax=Paraburkholderia sp. JHI869 TaxID=3112959 RepID=UPI00317FA89D